MYMLSGSGRQGSSEHWEEMENMTNIAYWLCANVEHDISAEIE